MMEFLCPRRLWGTQGEDAIREDDTCSYCGSMNPDTFMARLEAGDIELGATDKNYKVYVHNKGGAHVPLKFYFQHLSSAQMIRFVDLYNENKVHVDGGGFYNMPFFMSKVPK